MTTIEASTPVQAPNKLAGISGWLILPAIGAAVAPLFIGFQTAAGLSAFQYMSKVNGLVGAFILIEFLANVGLTAFACYNAWTFFKRKRNAPKVYIALLLASLGIQAADAAIGASLFNMAPDAEAGRDIGRAIVGCLVWIPYFLVSKRVKATFTE